MTRQQRAKMEEEKSGRGGEILEENDREENMRV